MAILAKDYCDYLFCELNDLKQRLDYAMGMSWDYATEEGGAEGISANLRDIQNVINEKLDVLGKSCPNWMVVKDRQNPEGRFNHLHAEGIPYGLTPM